MMPPSGIPSVLGRLPRGTVPTENTWQSLVHRAARGVKSLVRNMASVRTRVTDRLVYRSALLLPVPRSRRCCRVSHLMVWIGCRFVSRAPTLFEPSHAYIREGGGERKPLCFLSLAPELSPDDSQAISGDSSFSGTSTVVLTPHVLEYEVC